MDKLIYNRPDGGVSIVVPSPQSAIEEILGPMTEQEYEQHIMSVSIPAGATNVRSIAEPLIPTDRTFRNAWSDIAADGTVTYDMKKAFAAIDAKLQSEMSGYVTALALAQGLGRDTTAIQASIADCKSRVTQFDAIPIPAASSPATLVTLKSLVKAQAVQASPT